MKKYLVCSLNDENYTQADYDFYDTLDEAKEQCVQNVVECCEVTKEEAISHMEFTKSLNKDHETWNYDYSEGGSFFVNDIFEVDVNENDYLCVWHHAYGGVDFVVLKIGTEKECFDFMDNDSKETLNQDNIFDVDFANDSQIVIDTGEEWEVWDIIQYKESEVKKNEQ